MKDNLEQFFSENDFDVFEPKTGHENRFLEKLHTPPKKNKFWLGAVASVILLVSFLSGMYFQNTVNDLKDISQEMAETQNFYHVAITTTIQKIEEHKTSNNTALIEQSFETVHELEKHYNQLKKELKTGDNQDLIIFNMIKNYQKRIDILEQLLQVLNTQKTILTPKINNDEIS